MRLSKKFFLVIASLIIFVLYSQNTIYKCSANDFMSPKEELV